MIQRQLAAGVGLALVTVVSPEALHGFQSSGPEIPEHRPIAVQVHLRTGQERLDVLGDPLPQRAVARLGSSRLRHCGQISHLLFSPNGKRLAAWGTEHRGSTGFAIWDTASGRELRRGVLLDAWLDAWAWMPDGRLTAVLEDPEHDPYLFDFDATKIEGQPFARQDNGHDVRFAISPAGDLLAVSRNGDDAHGHTVEFRKLVPGRPARNLEVLRPARGPLRYATVLRFTPDGRRLVSFSPPGATPEDPRWTAVVWDVQTATERRRWKLPVDAFGGTGQALAVSNERLAVTFAGDGVLLYDLETGLEETLRGRHEVAEREAPLLENGVLAVLLARDGKTLVTAGSDHLVRFWDILGHKPVREFAWAGTRIEVMDLSPDGSVLAVGGREGVVRLLNAVTGAELFPQPGHTRRLTSVSASADGRIAATTGNDGTVRVWDLEKGRESRVIACDAAVGPCMLSPDRSSVLASVNHEEDPERSTLHVWNLADGREIRIAGLTGAWGKSVLFAPDGRTMFSVSGGKVAVRKWPQGERSREITLPTSGLPTQGTILALSHDGRLLVTMVRFVHLLHGLAIDASGGSLDLWDTRSGRRLRRLAGSDGLTERAAFTASGELLITSDEHLWDEKERRPFEESTFLHDVDVGTGRPKRVTRAPAHVCSLAVSPDGRTVYLGTREGPIHVCEVATGGVRHKLEGHFGDVRDLAVCAGGRRLVSAGGDASGLLWDVTMPPATAPDRLDTAWDALAAADAPRAYEAMSRLAAAPARSISLLRQHLLTARPEPGSDTPEPSRLREIRALELLEYLGTAEAIELLEDLARGDPTAPRTREAAAGSSRIRGMGSSE
jgi:WD40 repeat protein